MKRWVGVALVAFALAVLPFALAQIGTTWVRITNYAILYVLLGIVEALGAGYIGDFTDLCRYDFFTTRLAACAGGGNFVLFGSNYQDVFAFMVLILVLVFRPSGLLGERVGDRA